MPQREDYILRMIQQMSRVLARIREKLQRGEHVEAGADLEDAARQAGIDLRFVIALNEDSLRPMLFTGGELDRPKCALFAEVVYLEWQRAQLAGRADYTDRCADRALWLFRLAYEDTAVGPETAQKMEELAATRRPPH